MEIASRAPWPAGSLSNFAPHAFVFEGEQAASMEGFLQSLKFEDVEQAREIRALVGAKAKRQGAQRNQAWQSSQTLWWKGQPLARQSHELAGLIERAFRAMFAQSTVAKVALLWTGTQTLEHSMGASCPTQTVLTAQEFTSLLTRIRLELTETRQVTI